MTLPTPRRAQIALIVVYTILPLGLWLFGVPQFWWVTWGFGTIVGFNIGFIVADLANKR